MIQGWTDGSFGACYRFLSRSFVFVRFPGQVIRTGSAFVIRSTGSVVDRSVCTIIDRLPAESRRKVKKRRRIVERERERDWPSISFSLFLSLSPFPFIRLIRILLSILVNLVRLSINRSLTFRITRNSQRES